MIYVIMSRSFGDIGSLLEFWKIWEPEAEPKKYKKSFKKKKEGEYAEKGLPVILSGIYGNSCMF